MTDPRPLRVTPHLRELLADELTPLAVYRRLTELSPVRFLFESISGGERVSRYSFLGAAPSEILRLHDDHLEIEDPARPASTERIDGPPLAALRARLDRYRCAPGPVAIPFQGGYVGFFGYDAIRLIERLPRRPPDPYGLPIAVLARFDTVVAFDHAYQRMWVVSNEIEGEVSADAARARLDEVAARISHPAPCGAVRLPERRPAPCADVTPSLDGDSYQAAVRRAQESIAAGEIFQVVLARRFRIPRRIAPLALYRALRVVNPSPYMVLLEMPEVALVGASPEMLARKQGTRIETRPIAGTRRRGQDADEDRRLASDLLADPKERAEHVMLVDLGRNDLGRVAAAGSVRVPTFGEIENYSHVMHMVSSVEAELAAGRDALDVLLACFPAGTVSGAPKIRAMEIIDELEPVARGPYAGAIGYLSFTGDLDTCITLRTLVVQGDETSVTAGAGIVADSDPASEQRETESKAAGLLAAVALAETLEERA
jgi:anthranilate synthase component 1